MSQPEARSRPGRVGTPPPGASFERSLALHRAVAARVAEDERVLARARARVALWQRDGSVPSRFVEGWRVLLERPASDVARALVEPSDAMHELRQVSPFAGALGPRERWAILASLREDGA